MSLLLQFETVILYDLRVKSFFPEQREHGTWYVMSRMSPWDSGRRTDEWSEPVDMGSLNKGQKDLWDGVGTLEMVGYPLLVQERLLQTWGWVSFSEGKFKQGGTHEKKSGSFKKFQENYQNINEIVSNYYKRQFERSKFDKHQG